jgi:hypothetical protein
MTAQSYRLVGLALLACAITVWFVKQWQRRKRGSMTVQDEIEYSTAFGQGLEDIIVNKGSITVGQTPDRDR